MSTKFVFIIAVFISASFATLLGTVQGVVHDPSHRPVAGVEVQLRAVHSSFTEAARSGPQGEFEFRAVPAGEYMVRVSQPGFAVSEQAVTLRSGSTPVLHFQLQLAPQRESVEVLASPEPVNPQSATPSTLVNREDIQRTPGAGLSNSLAMITDFVPGAYVVHDQLHVRGGHQATWAIDGIPIPTANIATTVGPQIDPKDIDYLEVERGGYSSEYGDRTYGVFNVVPRTGFERDREMELNVTYGAFHQTNDQWNFGDHTRRFAYFGSINGNRSDYGLETPGPAVSHDRVWGIGGFASLIFNESAANQFRFVTSLRRDDYQIPNPLLQTAPVLQDNERERDALADFTWIRTLSPGLLLTVSPFFHFNRANYDPAATDTPVSTLRHVDSTFDGMQTALNAVGTKHNARIGIYGYTESDGEFIRLAAPEAALAPVAGRQNSRGHLEAGFLEDQFKLSSWLTLTAGARLTHFSGTVSENAASPRAGLALRIPRLNWVLRGFFGNYYQAPPLSTVSGPLANFAVMQGFAFIPLHGERDQENQVGLFIPIHGWSLDAGSFRLRARNFLDHNAIGDSNLFFPLSIAGARIYGWEFTARSPKILRRAELAIAYSYQHAQGQGAITGGLTDFSPPAAGYFFLDHDQRHTLHTNFHLTLPGRAWVAGDLYYGSGFTDGSSAFPRHLEPHATFDLAAGRNFGENWSLTLTALNAANRRFLLDNSPTFGGTHYADPRQIYIQVRYRFRF